PKSHLCSSAFIRGQTSAPPIPNLRHRRHLRLHFPSALCATAPVTYPSSTRGCRDNEPATDPPLAQAGPYRRHICIESAPQSVSFWTSHQRQNRHARVDIKSRVHLSRNERRHATRS